MKERNRCVESGCLGYCCRDIDIEISNDQRKRIFPDAVRVDSLHNLGWVKGQEVPGVYYTRYRKSRFKNGGYSVVVLCGPCPNISPEGACLKHEEREDAARNFKIGSPECNAIRAEHGLPPIAMEPEK